MFGFLKKKFGKSGDAEKSAEQAAEAQPIVEAAGEDLASAPAAVADVPSQALPAERAPEGEAVAEVAPAAAPAAPAAAPMPAEPEPLAIEGGVEASAPQRQHSAEAVGEPAPEQGAEREAAPAPSPEPTVEVASESAAESAGEPIAPQAVVPAAPVAKKSWTERLKAGLARTRQQIGGGLANLFGLRKIDEDLLEELESTLLMADCGVDATQHLMDDLRRRWKRDRLETADQLQKALADGLHEIIAPLEAPLQVAGHRPFIIMIAGVNGSGKTTSIGKLAKYFQAQGKSVLLAAGDTFRAAAREQLMTWGERNKVTVVAQDSGDAAAVIFDAINAARARNIDVVLADTAGRLPTQLHLMEEIAKVRRVIAKADPSGPHEVLLVLDANIGQNALAQVKAFDKAIGVTGLVVTKLDGTAKGGVLAAIARQCPKPLRFIGVGEGIDDLQPFAAREFVDALFEPGAGAVKNGAGGRA
ncbi:Signal recognition particle receptor FtsY [Thauera sp. GDN1]|uniref:signal recognition particle-docking protein FtsY n=1 Tax=Thauera sp. GDN1 TaxID=2944810 RepID=UPI003090114B|nr:Signal recognition particle receptor FtsY [Thauera sp. GDN1]